MSKTKHNPPGQKKSNFIPFGKVQQNYLMEVRTRQLREFNGALGEVYEELGIVERLKTLEGRVVLRKDLSGLDILPQIPKK